MLRQEPIDLCTRFPRGLRVKPIELMSARRVLIDLVLELFVGRLQGHDHVLDFQHVNVFIVGCRVNEQRGLQLVGM